MKKIPSSIQCWDLNISLHPRPLDQGSRPTHSEMLGQILVELNATKCIKCFLTIHNRLCESKNIWRLQKRRFDKNDASFKFEEVKGDISQSLSLFLFVRIFLSFSLLVIIFQFSLSLFGFHLSILSFPLLQSFYLCFYSVFCLFHSLFLSLCHAVSVSVSLVSLFFLLYLRSICLLRKLFCL